MRLNPVHWIYLVLAIGSLVYVAVVRPWLIRWGADDDEARRPLPGDELVPSPSYVTTRAITIDAPVEAVWTWLLQLGQGRGGFYTYDWLENLAQLDIHSVDCILPELQELQVGDQIHLDPEGQMLLAVVTLNTDRAMVLRTGPMDAPVEAGNYLSGGIAATWAYVLEPVSDESARLIVRWRADWQPSLVASLLNVLMLEPAHFIMERGMMRGIKRRAEWRSLKDQTSKLAE